MKYHLSPNGPRRCTASIRECPLGGEDIHFSTQAEAQSAYEAKMSEAFGTFEPIKRTNAEKIRQASYKMDDFQEAALNATARELKSVGSAFISQAHLAKASAQQSKAASFLTSLKRLPAILNAKLDAAVLRAVEQEEAAALRRAETREHLARLTEISSRRLRAASTVATGAVKRQYDEYKTSQDAARAAKPLKQKFAPAHRIQKGDLVEGGLIVSKVIDEGGSVKLHLRRSSGTFAGVKVYEDTEVVPYKRARRRDVKKTVSAGRKPWRESAFVSRVKAASKLQAEAARALFAVESTAALKREPQLKRPLPDRYRRATAVVAAERAEAAFVLQGIASEHKRKRARRAS